MIQEKTVVELKAMMDNGEDFQLIDIREAYEFDICNLNGMLIPVDEIEENIEKISREKPVVLHCRSGSRSAYITEYLQNTYHFTNLYNLKGGILAWSNEIDPSITKY